MRFRILRIAFSVTCLVACVLLMALWVRSYLAWPNAAFIVPPHFSEKVLEACVILVLPAIAFAIPLCRSAIIGQRWRFSLRTLLIVTTLLAVGLGLIAWLR